MPEDILSPINKESVAEQALLKFLREKAVFEPPKEDFGFPYAYRGNKQSLNVDRLLHATLQFIDQNCYLDPKIMTRLLLKEIELRL